MITMINQKVYIVWAHAIYNSLTGDSDSESQLMEVYANEEDAIKCVKSLVSMIRNEKPSNVYILKNHMDTDHFVELHDTRSPITRYFGYWIKEVK